MKATGVIVFFLIAWSTFTSADVSVQPPDQATMAAETRQDQLSNKEKLRELRKRSYAILGNISPSDEGPFKLIEDLISTLKDLETQLDTTNANIPTILEKWDKSNTLWTSTNNHMVNMKTTLTDKIDELFFWNNRTHTLQEFANIGTNFNSNLSDTNRIASHAVTIPYLIAAGFAFFSPLFLYFSFNLAFWRYQKKQIGLFHLQDY